MQRDDSFYRAVQRRDPRFDGRFYTAVLTTKIFCRPVCPARTPLRENVRFYLTPEEAEAAGFRACKRCRPSSPAWKGTTATVQRALRLFDQGETGVEEVTEQLGVGARQLRRLFAETLGTTPREVALTCRLNRVQALLSSEGSLSEIADRAGFRSVRAFNAAVRSAFGTQPSALRAESRPLPFELILPVRPPFDFKAALGYFRPRAVRGIEDVGIDTYARTFALPEGQGVLAVCHSHKGEVTVRVHGPAAALLEVARRVRQMFDLDAAVPAIHEALERSTLIAPLVARRPGLRLFRGFDPFESTVRVVLAQQVTTRGAATLAGRWVERLGKRLDAPIGNLTHQFPSAAVLAELKEERAGMPKARVAAIKAVARSALAAGVPRLVPLPGIGPWTLDCVAVRAHGDPDAFPATDLVLRKVAQLDAEALLAAVEPCRPFRAYAAAHLWAAQSVEEKDHASHSVAS